MTAAALPAALVLTPLLGAVLAILTRTRPRAAGWVGTLTALATTTLTGLLIAAIATTGTIEMALGGWAPPLGIAVRADGTSAIFLALTGVVGLGASLYAAADARTTGPLLPGSAGRFWPLWLLAWAGMNTVYVAGDLFNMYVALEVLGLAAVGLVALGGHDAWRPAFRYLLVAVLGSLFFLVMVGAVYATTGTLDYVLAGQRIAQLRTEQDVSFLLWPLVLAAVGTGLKTALFPLHAWLPPAHAAAPPAVSPILSALVIKASFFVLLRVWFEVIGPDPRLATGLGVLGAGALLWGGVLAMRQSGFKRIVAYSTVAQVGYFFLIFPLTAHAADAGALSDAWFGGLMLLVAHGLSKAAIFMSAGSLYVALETDDLDGIVGAARTFPMLGMTVGLSSLVLAGLPISLAFTGKWQYLAAALHGGQWWWIALLLLATLLSAAYLVRPVAALLRASDEADEEKRTEAYPIPRRLQLIPLTLATLGVLLGLNSGLLADLAGMADLAVIDAAAAATADRGEHP